jgi:hypothetical protein
VRDVINAVYWLIKKDTPMLKINKVSLLHV